MRGQRDGKVLRSLVDGWLRVRFLLPLALSPSSSEVRMGVNETWVLWWGGNGISGLVSLVPHLVSCVALFIIAVGLGERQVRKSRRRKGWKGIAGCSLTSGSSFPLFYSLPPCLSLLLSLEELKRPPLSLSRFLAGNRLAAGRHASLGRARLPNGWKSV